ncbi:MAG: RNA polymerase sigma factor [Bacteroidota bacterium]
MDGKQLIREIVKGNENAFEMLYNRFSTKVYNTALSYAKNIGDAEEITQDVFVKIYKGAGSFKGSASVEAWVYRITVNTSLNYLKKRNRFSFFKKAFPISQSVDFNHPGVLLERKEQAAMLFSVMDGLADRQKTAFILSYIESLPRQEVADIMEISLKAVESLLQRAKHNLRLKLEKTSPDQRKSQN